MSGRRPIRFGPRFRDVPVAAQGGPQRPEGGLLRVVDADARAGHDLHLRRRLAPADEERRPVERDSVELAADTERLADLAGAAGEIARPGRAGPTPVFAHPRLAFDRLAGPQQHGAAEACLA